MPYHTSRTLKPVRVLFILLGLTMVFLLYSRSIPLGYLPSSQNKAIQIKLEYRGAFEEEIEKVITNPMEKALSKIAGIKEIFSVSEQEKARINILFFAETDLGKAYLRIREAVDTIYASLPDGVQRPVISKSDIDSKPVFIAAFENRDYLSEDYLKNLYENIKGTGKVDIGGGIKKEIQIAFNPDEMTEAKIAISHILKSIRGNNIIGGFGREMESPYIIDARLKNIEEIKELRVTRNICLGEVAEVTLTEARKESIGRVNGKEKIIVYVHEAGDANTVDLCRKLKQVTRGIPEGMIIYNYGERIEDSLGEILIAIISGILFVTILTFLFLHKLYPALLVSLNIPFSILFTLTCLNFLGYEINVMTLSGMAIGVGLVIDSGIVYVEEFFAVSGNSEKTLRGTLSPILFSSATTIAVFFPLLFAERELADQFGGLAIAVSCAIIASVIFVFLFMPPLLSLSFDRNVRIKSPRFILSLLKKWFLPAGKYRAVLTGLSLILLIASGFIIYGLKWESFNFGMRNALSLKLEYPSGTRLEYVLKTAGGLENFITSLKGLKAVSSKYEKERASFDLILNNGTDRKTIIDLLKSQELYYRDAFFYFPQNSSGEASFEVVLSGKGNIKLRESARALAAEVRKSAAVTGIIFHYKDEQPVKQVNIDLTEAHTLGVNPKDIYSSIYWSLTGPVASKWNPPEEAGFGNLYTDIRLFAGKLKKAGLEELLEMRIISPEGKAVSLKDTAVLSEKAATGRIYHLGRQRSASFSVATGKADKGVVMKSVNKIIADFPFPEGYRAEASRAEKEEKRLIISASFSLLLSIMLILIILIFQFEGIRIPLIVISQIPLSFILPVLSLKIFDLPLSLPVMVGLILAAGISVNNCILVFDQLKKRKLKSIAVYSALKAKFRAILIASLTTIMGVLPLLFTARVGAGILAPLSLTIATGITGSLIFLLVSLAALFKLEI